MLLLQPRALGRSTQTPLMPQTFSIAHTHTCSVELAFSCAAIRRYIRGVLRKHLKQVSCEVEHSHARRPRSAHDLFAGPWAAKSSSFAAAGACRGCNARRVIPSQGSKRVHFALIRQSGHWHQSDGMELKLPRGGPTKREGFWIKVLNPWKWWKMKKKAHISVNIH